MEAPNPPRPAPPRTPTAISPSKPPQPLPQRQKLRHPPLFHVADDLGAFGCEGVKLVEEDDAGRVALRFFEDLAQLGLALAVVLVDDLRAVHVDEMRPHLAGDCPGNQGLARAWRSDRK